MLAVLQNQSNLNKAEQFLALKYLNEGRWESEMKALLIGQEKLDNKVKKQLNIQNK